MTLTPSALALAATLAGTSAAQPDAALPPAVQPGLYVLVLDDFGASYEGRVEDATRDVLTLARRGRTLTVPLDRIVRIDKPDSLRNGAITGLVVGVTLAIVGNVATGFSGGPVVIAWRTVGNSVFCTLLGMLADLMVDNSRTLYQRGRARIVAEVAGRGAGVQVTLGWGRR
jgi:hypothetical protein